MKENVRIICLYKVLINKIDTHRLSKPLINLTRYATPQVTAAREDDSMPFSKSESVRAESASTFPSVGKMETTRPRLCGVP